MLKFRDATLEVDGDGAVTHPVAPPKTLHPLAATWLDHHWPELETYPGKLVAVLFALHAIEHDGQLYSGPTRGWITGHARQHGVPVEVTNKALRYLERAGLMRQVEAPEGLDFPGQYVYALEAKDGEAA